MAVTQEIKVTKNWGRWPEAWGRHEVTAVAVDSEDNVYAFVRGPHPVVVFNPDGEVERTWGEGHFTHPHAISIAPDGSILCTDDEAHRVSHFSNAGELIGVIEHGPDPEFYKNHKPSSPWTIQEGGPPFNKPTGAIAVEDGTVYVTDGYGNCRVHAFSSTGELKFSWGEPGYQPGNFTIPHGITRGPDGLLYVADRVNSRIQIFDLTGEYVGEWGARLPNNLCFDDQGYAYVAELGSTVVLADLPTLRWPPARITVRDREGTILAEVREDDPAGAGMFYSPHGIAVDSKRHVYAAEVPFSFSEYSKYKAPPETSILRRYESIEW